MLIKELKYSRSDERKLVILRGMMGAGKSTFIKNNNLEGYTLSMDNLRETVLTPVLNEVGFLSVNNEHNSYIADLFYQLLDKKLSQGSMVVVDNMNLSQKYIKGLTQKGDEYGYVPYIINFDEDFETIKERNNQRLKNKSKGYIPNEIIEKSYITYEQNTDYIKGKYNFIDSKDTESITKLFENQYTNLDGYKEVKVIGDIHGCYSVLKTAIPEIKDDTFYIFLGDYIDRGTENYKVVEYLRREGKKDNVILLEGNHEIHARAYANNYDLGYGKEFKNHTRPEFEDNKVSKKDIKKFVNLLRTSFLFSFNNKKYVCTHGGILPTNVNKLSESQKIKGVGGYTFNVDERWEELTKNSGLIQFHGHRNKFKVLPNQYKRSFNLENKVDSGGFLRVATIKGKTVKVDEIKNDTVRGKDKVKCKQEKLNNYLNEVVENNKGTVKELELDGKSIKSLVFRTRYIMNHKVDKSKDLVIRGLFSDSKEILVRGYNKFYNYSEVGMESIKELNFPIVGYKKENGYLGLVSYSNQYGFLYATKSVVVNDNSKLIEDGKNRNEYAIYLRDMFNRIFTKEQKELLKNHMLLNETTISFEVISQEDKHITQENKDKLVLLDSIKNDLKYETLKYNELEKLTNMLNQYENKGFHLKEKGKKFKDFNNFKQFVENDKTNMIVNHEGYVFTDSKGYTFKYKSVYYNYWKEVRKTFQKVSKRGQESKHVNIYLSNFPTNFGVNHGTALDYINKSNQMLVGIYENLEDYKYIPLVTVNGEVDIPKIAETINSRVN